MDAAQIRQELKKDIVAYLNSVGVSDRDLLIKALDAIKAAAYEEAEVVEDMMADQKTRQYLKALGLKKGDPFYYRLSWHFAPSHYLTLVSFVQRYEALLEAEMQADLDLESAIQAEVYDQVSDGALYDEHGSPDFIVVVHQDHVEVRGYVKGVGDRIPKKNRKYDGYQDGVNFWSFPLSELPALKRLSAPIIEVSELCPAK